MVGLVWGAWYGVPGMGGLVWGAWNGGPGIVRNVPNPRVAKRHSHKHFAKRNSIYG